MIGWVLLWALSVALHIGVAFWLLCVYLHRGGCPASAMGNRSFFWWSSHHYAFASPMAPVVAELRVRRSIPRAACTTGFAGLWATVGAHFAPPVTGSTFTVGGKYRLHVPQCYQWVSNSLGVRIAIELALVGRHGHGNGSRWPRPIGSSGWRRRRQQGAVHVVGIVGIWFACNNGFANDMSFKTFVPNLGDTNSLTYLSIILFKTFYGL